MGSCSSWSCNYWVLKVLLVGFCWLLLVGLMLQSSSVRGRTISSSSSSGSTSRRRAVLIGQTSPRHDEEVVIGNKDKQNELVFNPELDLNYMVRKRRVPNGPDPIHNRKLPPGQA